MAQKFVSAKGDTLGKTRPMPGVPGVGAIFRIPPIPRNKGTFVLLSTWVRSSDRHKSMAVSDERRGRIRLENCGRSWVTVARQWLSSRIAAHVDSPTFGGIFPLFSHAVPGLHFTVASGQDRDLRQPSPFPPCARARFRLQIKHALGDLGSFCKRGQPQEDGDEPARREILRASQQGALSLRPADLVGEQGRSKISKAISS